MGTWAVGQDPVDNLWVFAVSLPFPFLPTEHTLGGGPSQVERAGGTSVENHVGALPCTKSNKYVG